jgi:hypothetical protein
VNPTSRSSTFPSSPFLSFYSCIHSFIPFFLPSSRNCFHARLLANAKLVRVDSSPFAGPIYWGFPPTQAP